MTYWKLSFISIILCCLPLHAQVHKPNDPEQVLATVGKNLSYADFHTNSASSKSDHKQRLSQIQEFIDLAKTSGDLRYLAYAERLLDQVVDPGDLWDAWLINRADIAQYRHDFDAANAALTQLLQRNPDAVQARIMRATLLLSQGRYSDAAQDCDALVGKVAPIYSQGCRSLVKSHQGKLRASYTEIIPLAETRLRVDLSTRHWLLAASAEMAERLGDLPAAESYYKQALHIKPADSYVLMQLSDLYLRQQRATQVLTLLKNHKNHDALLLRWVHALQLEKQSQPDTDVQRLHTRMAELKQVTDTNADPHLRELSYYQLHIQNNATEATRLAAQNWHRSKEKIDLHLLGLAAKRAGDQSLLTELKNWQHQTGYEDQYLTYLFESKK